MFESGFHKATFVLGVASCVAMFVAFEDWLGLIPAILLCVPTGLLFTLVPAMVLGTIRQLRLRPSDRALSFSSAPIGLAFAAWAISWNASAGVRALGALAGIGYIVVGYGIYKMEATSALLRQMRGEEPDVDDAQYLRDLT